MIIMWEKVKNHVGLIIPEWLLCVVWGETVAL